MATKPKFDMSSKHYDHLGKWKEGSLIDMGYQCLGEPSLGLDPEEAERFEECCDKDMDMDDMGKMKAKLEDAD